MKFSLDRLYVQHEDKDVIRCSFDSMYGSLCATAAAANEGKQGFRPESSSGSKAVRADIPLFSFDTKSWMTGDCTQSLDAHAAIQEMSLR